MMPLPLHCKIREETIYHKNEFHKVLRRIMYVDGDPVSCGGGGGGVVIDWV